MSELTRRDLLKLSGAAAAAGLGFPAVLEAQSKELVMLGLWSFTGAFADVGPVLDRGMKMALDERGMKIQGRAIKYITRDDETKAGSATRRAEEAIDAEGAKYIIGRSEEHTSELQSHHDLVCRLLLEKKKKNKVNRIQK